MNEFDPQRQPLRRGPPPPASGGAGGPQQELLRRAGGVSQQILEQLNRVVVGQTEAIRQVLTAFLAGGNVLIEGVPGLGKTLLVLSLARAFGGRFARVQFTPDLMPSDVTGHAIYDANTGEFRVRRGPAFTNLLLADEINRAPAKTQAALLEVMQEHQITIEGEAHETPAPFMCLATQNPIEQEGTYPLPEAQLDRFLLKVVIDYPEERDEVRIVRGVTEGQVGDALDVSGVQQVIDAGGVLQLQQACAALHVEERVTAYAVRIVRATRRWSGVAVGAGPRGAIALIRLARGAALLEGRGFVTPDDVKRLAIPALRHRIVVAPELEIEGLRADDVLGSVLEKVEAPRG